MRFVPVPLLLVALVIPSSADAKTAAKVCTMINGVRICKSGRRVCTTFKVGNFTITKCRRVRH